MPDQEPTSEHPGKAAEDAGIVDQQAAALEQLDDEHDAADDAG
jgi:hypothetical protein